MSTPSLQFSLNHMVCPALTPLELLDAATKLGVSAVELRNDVGANSLTDLEQARAVGERAKTLGLEVLSINALYPFNIWNEERAAQAERLAQLAAACGATGLVACPLNDGSHLEASTEKRAGLEAALRGLGEILARYNLKGFIEPLGFPISSLRFKREAIDAIDAIGSADRFQLVHDTFHHQGASEQELFPQRTGLVHISGLEDADISFTDMLDGHRVLVGPADRLDNLGQLKALLAAGYTGPISFEPFSEQVWDLPDPIASTRQSMDYIRAELSQ